MRGECGRYGSLESSFCFLSRRRYEPKYDRQTENKQQYRANTPGKSSGSSELSATTDQARRIQHAFAGPRRAVILSILAGGKPAHFSHTCHDSQDRGHRRAPIMHRLCRQWPLRRLPGRYRRMRRRRRRPKASRVLAGAWAAPAQAAPRGRRAAAAGRTGVRPIRGPGPRRSWLPMSGGGGLGSAATARKSVICCLKTGAASFC